MTTLLTSPDLQFMKDYPDEANLLSQQHRGVEKNVVIGISGIIAFDGKKHIGQSFLSTDLDPKVKQELEEMSYKAFLEMQKDDPAAQDPAIFVDFFLMVDDLSTSELFEDE